jgi:chromosome segregation protein
LPVSLSRLRIAGFKSFAEPATLEILPGLTGIVGPNGCGKSNVVEALRWTMGESSARALRGGEMDDVIFAGTAHRPSRNLAEVTIVLNDAKGLAPPPFQEAADLEVTRRIERGVGSHFRVNGRETRAKDVQTLFADLATGARASAMVSQGRIGALVSARPDERRAILEEAAGITGLHSRRHEAELKLRAAETNLERAEDARARLATQLDGLTKQARQAARFRDLGDLIRRAEAELLSVQQAIAERNRAAARAGLSAAQAAVAEAAAASQEAAPRAAEAAAALPALRSAEAEARAALERARLHAEQAEGEATRAAQAGDEAARRAAQARRDHAHAEQSVRDAEAALRRLSGEQAALQDESARAPDPAALAAAVGDAQAALAEAEAQAEQASARATTLAAAHRAADEALAAAQRRAQRAGEQAARLAAERDRAQAAAVAAEALQASEAAAEHARVQAAQARAHHEAAERDWNAARLHAATTREQAAVAQGERGRLRAAAQGLAEALADPRPNAASRMIDAITVPAGLETALGSALGEDLDASADPADARHWHTLPSGTLPPLPEGAEPFSARIGAPAVLARALSQAGMVARAEDAAALQAMLLPGQSVATPEGDVFRWDGFRIRAGAPTRATVRLQQRNRLLALRRELEGAETVAAAAQHAREQGDEAERAASSAEQRTRAASRDAELAAQQARDQHARLSARAAAAGAQLAGLETSLGHAQAEFADAQAARDAADAAREKLGDAGAARAAAERARTDLATRRGAEQAARAARDAQATAAQARGRRLATLAEEIAAWQARDADARGRLADLAGRAAQAEAEHAALAERPAALAVLGREALEARQAAEGAWRRAGAAVRQGETLLGDAERDARAAQAALSTARENLVRAEGEVAQADAAWGTVAERILERLGVSPSLPDPPAELTAESDERARRRLERLQRERDSFGPVNMRAEIEAAEIGEQVATIAREGAELATAIAKLRGSIGHLNREGRERLGQVFADIDRHFRSLFETMFGGGRAHLAMVGSDDPLLAGLEIFAQPPGKKLATLSLLSGGEQALTALSLIFAVFRCNPAPVCVLDEVDAPLDDANVDRFCALLRAMVGDTGTRFLIVTHHQLTMARMDRLYGVTMQERGVSRLLSVDLSHAVELTDQVAVAAE